MSNCVKPTLRSTILPAISRDLDASESPVEESWLDDAFGGTDNYWFFQTPGTVDGTTGVSEWRSRTNAAIKFVQGVAGMEPELTADGARCYDGKWMQGNFSNGDNDQTVILLCKCGAPGAQAIIYGHLSTRLYHSYDGSKYLSLGAANDSWAASPSDISAASDTTYVWDGTWEFSTKTYAQYINSITQNGGKSPWGGTSINGRNDLGAADGSFPTNDTTVAAIYHLEGTVLTSANRAWAGAVMAWALHDNYGIPDYVNGLDLDHPYKVIRPTKEPPT